MCLLKREGLTLHDITYDGRSVFYRLSLSEMFVPYGDSRAPYPRKAAFDLGSNLAGVNSNNLKLGRHPFKLGPATKSANKDEKGAIA